MIDLHTHAIAGDASRYPERPLGGERSAWSQTRPVTAEQLVESLDQAGVDKAALVQASTLYGVDNSYAADSIERHPDRLIGVATVDFLAPDAVAVTRELIEGRGFSGMRLRTSSGTTEIPMPGTGIDDPGMNPVWEYLEAQRVPVCIGMRPEQTGTLIAVLARFPQLVVALDHAGGAARQWKAPYDGALQLLQLLNFPNVFLKLTTVTLIATTREPGGDPTRFVRSLVDHFGADRIAWGSNFPASEGSLADLRERAQAAFSELSPDERAAIFDGTARRIYPGLASNR